jgi:hypothetical protein
LEHYPVEDKIKPSLDNLRPVTSPLVLPAENPRKFDLLGLGFTMMASSRLPPAVPSAPHPIRHLAITNPGTG